MKVSKLTNQYFNLHRFGTRIGWQNPCLNIIVKGYCPVDGREDTVVYNISLQELLGYSLNELEDTDQLCDNRQVAKFLAEAIEAYLDRTGRVGYATDDCGRLVPDTLALNDRELYIEELYGEFLLHTEGAIKKELALAGIDEATRRLERDMAMLKNYQAMLVR